MSLRIAMIGNDGHYGTVAGSIPKIPDLELIAWARSRPEDPLDSQRKYPAFHAGVREYEHYELLLEKEEPDIVCVSNPLHEIAPASLAALRRGIHVIAEKPLAITLEDLSALHGAARENRACLQALFTMRYDPVFHAVHEAVKAGRIGDPILATGQKSYRWGESRPWFYRTRNTYGGTIPWIAIHAVDYIRWTTGREFTRVAAAHSNRNHGDYPGCEDNGGLLFTMEGGGHALVNFDYLRPEAAPTHGDDRLRIAGTAGTIEVRDTGTRVELTTRSRGPEDLPLPPRRDQLADFVDWVRTGREPRLGLEDSIRVTGICLRARDAADRGIWVDLHP